MGCRYWGKGQEMEQSGMPSEILPLSQLKEVREQLCVARSSRVTGPQEASWAGIGIGRIAS